MQLGSISQMINSIHEAPSRNGFRVPVSLQIGTRVIRTTTLLDSGATTCFMDVLFGHIHSIAKVVKTKPIPVDLISFPRHPVMLGFSWLVMHNPIVDWRRLSLDFTTQMAKANNNLKVIQDIDASPSQVKHENDHPAQAATTVEPSNSILSKYGEFSNVFEKQNVD